MIPRCKTLPLLPGRRFRDHWQPKEKKSLDYVRPALRYAMDELVMAY